MDNETLRKIIEQVLEKRFRSRGELAKWLGVDCSYISRMSRVAIQRGLVDPKSWRNSFRTGRTGQRGPDRKNQAFRTFSKVKARLSDAEAVVQQEVCL
jgi:hypothetical protein